MSTFRGPERVTDPTTLEAIFSLRAVVWSAEAAVQDHAPIEWRDEYDLAAMHWAAWLHDELVGSARLTIHESINDVPDSLYFLSQNIVLSGRIASLNRLVISPAARGFGLSRRFDDLRLRAAQDAGVDYAVGYAFARRAKVVARAGFEIIGKCNANIPFVGVREICLLAKAFSKDK